MDKKKKRKKEKWLSLSSVTNVQEEVLSSVLKVERFANVTLRKISNKSRSLEDSNLDTKRIYATNISFHAGIVIRCRLQLQRVHKLCHFLSNARACNTLDWLFFMYKNLTARERLLILQFFTF